MFPGRFPPPTAQTFTPPSTGSVPDNVIPVAVVSCEPTFGRSRLDANGNPVGTEVTVDEVRHAGDLTVLLSALSEDSDPQGWWIEAWFGKTRDYTGGAHCTPGIPCSMLWLVDADGRAIRPAIPKTRSGGPKPDAREAIARLTVVDRTSHGLFVPRSDS
ncbi:hypothetical protein DEU38_102390 [Rhodococcus sp. AG1013]|nr:hypothetical protein DEU38_102390 [Rhodococcus sp. AG1013]